MKKKPIIKVENISKTNGKDVIFENVSFEINEHQFVSLKGPSGCGKTTFMRILSGLIEPTGGRVYLNGELASSPKILIPPHKREMSLLFQELALWPHMTGHEQLKFVWESTEKETFKDQVEKVCDDIGLPSRLLSKYPSELSRGEQQRLAIARTLISEPAIILLDEPLTALDQELRTQFITFLRRLKKRKIMTAIIISHDLMTDGIEYDKEVSHRKNTFCEKVKPK